MRIRRANTQQFYSRFFFFIKAKIAPRLQQFSRSIHT